MQGVLLYGPPGTGKTLLARAVANRTDACFIRVIGSELVQKYVGEGARMVRELFEMARSKKVGAAGYVRYVWYLCTCGALKWARVHAWCASCLRWRTPERWVQLGLCGQGCTNGV
jgi:hypothetical protein